MATDMIALGEYEGVAISARPSDGYINATEMCKAAGKLWGHYWANQSTQEFVAELSRSIGIPIDLLVVSAQSGPNRLRGTWVHRHVAIDLAAWISPSFKVWMIDKTDKLLLTGTVSVHREHSEHQLAECHRELAQLVTSGFRQASQELGSLRNDLNDFKGNVNERFTKLEDAVLSKPKPFGTDTRRAAALAIRKYFSGRCPVNGTPIVDEYGEPLEQMHLHHWGGAGGCDPKYAFPVSIAGHREIESSRAAKEAELQPIYQAIQVRLQSELIAIRSGRQKSNGLYRYKHPASSLPKTPAKNQLSLNIQSSK